MVKPDIKAYPLFGWWKIFIFSGGIRGCRRVRGYVRCQAIGNTARGNDGQFDCHPRRKGHRAELPPKFASAVPIISNK